MLSAERCGMTARTRLAARKDSPKKRRKERGLDEASRQNWWLGLGALTGLRFFAAIHVFMFHFGAGFAERSGAPRQIVTYLKNGYLGVSIFFVLSRFILT